MIQKLKNLRPAPKLTPEQIAIGLARRDATRSATSYELFFDHNNPTVRVARFALNAAGVAPKGIYVSRALRPQRKGIDVVAEVKIPEASDTFGVTIDRKIDEKGSREKYHVAFGPNKAAVVTNIGEEGELLKPTSDPVERLDKINFAHIAFDEVINSRVKKDG